MRPVAAVLLLLGIGLPASAGPQEALPDRLSAACRDLESGDSRRVFAAVQAIAQLGGAALPSIEARTKESKGRVRDYLELAAEEIRIAPHLPAFPAVRKVTMKSADKNVVELLSDLRAKTGAAISLENLLDEENLPEITVDVKDATMLEAFDAICHAGNVTVSMENGQFELYTGAYVDLPRFFFGHYFFRLSEFEVKKTVTFRKPSAQSFTIQMETVWDPAAAPSRFKSVRVVEALDDRGRSLVLPPADPAVAAPGDEDDPDAEGSHTFLRLVPPSPAATKITVLRGFSTIVLPKGRATTKFAAPAAGQTATSGEFEARIRDLDAEHHFLTIELSSKKQSPEVLNKLGLMGAVSVKGWDAARTAVTKTSWNESALEVTVTFEPMRLKDQPIRPPEENGAPVLERVDLSVVTSTQEKRIPFEFRDLKLK